MPFDFEWALYHPNLLSILHFPIFFRRSVPLSESQQDVGSSKDRGH